MEEHVEKEVIRLKAEGKTFEEIGKILGFTKQRAHQIYHEVQERKNALLTGLKKQI